MYMTEVLYKSISQPLAFECSPTDRWSRKTASGVAGRALYSFALDVRAWASSLGLDSRLEPVARAWARHTDLAH